MKPNAIELIFALHQHDRIPGISKLPGLWERKLDEQWTIWINGHMKPLAAGSTGAKMMVRPGDCYVEFNGWPWGSFSVIRGDGIVGAGGLANYDTFCEALNAAIQSPEKPWERKPDAGAPGEED